MPTKPSARGFLALVLHAHLPYVRHPEYEDFMEERWLYEAITETYIPLLEVYDGLLHDGVDFRVTMSITPPLVGMLADPLLQGRYVRHIERLIELAEKEVKRTKHQPEFHETAKMYLRKFNTCRRIFVEENGNNLIRGFRRVMESGKLEIITCGATHGFMPLMQVQPNAIRAQIKMACQHHEEHFGRRPTGIWNGECGYFAGLDQFLAEEGLRYFFVDAHGILFADRRPKYGVYAPLICPHTGVAAFGRDLESSMAVWSAEVGYPGDPNYREFYRDIGYDLDFDYIKPYIHESGFRIATGMKYHRTTGRVDLSQKQPYDEQTALNVASTHAGNFMFNRERQVDWLSGGLDRKPIIVCPYDAELFGHWWYEGPKFLDYLFRKIEFDQQNIGMITPKEYLEIYSVNQVGTPSLSSWGNNGYCEVWLESSNDWIYRHLHKAAERMGNLARKHQQARGVNQRALNQAARELLLAQSSDWAFIMKTGTTVEYAVKRTRDHLMNFTELYEQLESRQVDESFVADLEFRNNIFPKLDYRIFA